MIDIYALLSGFTLSNLETRVCKYVPDGVKLVAPLMKLLTLDSID